MNAARNTPNSWPITTHDRQEQIRRRAEEIYVRNGKIPGHDLENWALAEQEILRESQQASGKKSIVVRVKGVEYIGEYNPEDSDGYVPGEFGDGSSIPVRFRGGQMFVQRPNGKELATTIVKKKG